ncbi:MAG: hypothetical protein IJX08_09710 [Clostridia bacterium]|nr:hypothetical protein [Clostridia bacterium]
MQQTKKTVGQILRLLGAILLVSAMGVGGIFAGADLPEAVKNGCGIGALAALILLGVLLIASVIGAQFYKKSMKLSVKEQQEYFLSRKSEAEQDLDKVVQKIVLLRRLMKGFALFLLFFALAFSFLSGIGGADSFSALSLFPVYLCYGALSRLFPHREKFKFEGYCAEKDYPEIHALAHKAAKALNMDGKIRIVFLNDCNAGIAKIGDTYSLQLGVNLLDVMSSDELYQILLHEFAHLTKDGNPTDKEYALFADLAEGDGSVFSRLTNILFSLPDTFYIFEYYIYRLSASVFIEERADRAILEKGDPQTAVNGMAKLGYNNLFEKELHRFIDDHYYSAEQPRENTCQVVNEALRRAIIERGAFYKELLLKEIQPRSASHPIFRLRMQALGVKDFEVRLPDHTDAYGQECKKAAQELSKEIAETIKDDYAQVREERYVKPLAIIEEYRKSGQTLTAEEARPVFDALMAFSYYDEAEALCDRLLQTTENHFATAHALYTKGCILLGRYDKQGIDFLYEAMDINHNYVEEGLSMIGEFCCTTGDEQGLETYRERALFLGQKQIDEVSHTGELTVKDRLVAETMPKEMLEDILAFIKKSDEGVLSEVHLVRKLITDDYFCSFFILHFKKDAEEEKMARVYDKIFNHLDTRPEDWQFSLFVYDESLKQVMAKIEKIKGTKVFSADEP